MIMIVIKGTVYVQGLNFSIFIFSIEIRFLLQPFKPKRIIQKEQIFAEKLGKGVWVRCLFV